MDKIFEFLGSIDPIYAAVLATVFTWLVTALGASVVFLFRTLQRKWLDGMLGFTGGVMIAASVWSLIIPALENQEAKIIQPGLDITAIDKILILLPVVVGITLGAGFLYLLDKYLPHLHINFPKEKKEGIEKDYKKPTLLILAITLHNIPEGLAVGVLFGAASNAADTMGMQETIVAATTLAIGIGLQNFPEGMAVAFPLRRHGVSRFKSFWYGQLSAIVEPVAGFLGAFAVTFFDPLLPYALAFAAGAMLYVVIEEVIPETQQDQYTDIATLGFILGFMVMMSLDVGLS